MSDKNKGICNYQGCNRSLNHYPSEFCVFHAPKEEKGVDESNFDQLIQDEYNNDNYNFEGAIFPWIVRFFAGILIPKTIHFEKAEFQNGVDFENTEFSKGVYFNKAKFLGNKTNFSKVKFIDDASFMDAEFDCDEIDFSSVKFSKGAFFSRAKFKRGKADFTETEFSGDTADFSHVEFHDKVDFRKSKFMQCVAKFDNIKFLGETNFRYVEFSGNLTDFSNSEFLKEPNFSYAKFLKGSSHFYNTKFKNGVFFQGVEFSGDRIDFHNAKFFNGTTSFGFGNFTTKNTSFKEAKFSETDVDFESTVFKSSITFFDKTVFENCSISFRQTEFSEGSAIFQEAKFSGESIEFIKAKFSGGDANFINTEFNCKKIDFSQSEFTGGDALFNNAKFIGSLVMFDEAKFSHDIYFKDNEIKYGIKFPDIILGEKSTFYFQNPELLIQEKDEKSEINAIRIIFESVQFNSFNTYFENIHSKSHLNSSNILDSPVLIFRYCQLKDVYFTNNDMFIFSFYKSSFDEARFISCNWGEQSDKIFKIKYNNRRNVIFEEYLYEKRKSLINEGKNITVLNNAYKIEDLKDYWAIAEIYRRMKTALDRTKDFPESGWFYYNEFEMRKLALKDKKNKNVREKCFLFVHKIYRSIAGYGQMPIRSLIWFGLLLFLIFSPLHLLSGFKKGEDIINYKIAISYDGLNNFLSLQTLKNFGISLLYTFSHVIPINYFPYQKFGFSALTTYGIFLSLFNSLSLIILVIFIAVGLKRHFRRF